MVLYYWNIGYEWNVDERDEKGDLKIKVFFG